MNGPNRLVSTSLGGWRGLAAAASVLLVLGLGSSAGAQDGNRQPAPPPAAEQTPAESPEQAPAGDGESPRARGDSSDDVFVPTEEIAADEEVYFPVDI